MKKFYTATIHNIIKAMGKANISFPTTKVEITEKAGDIMIQNDFNTFVPFKELFQYAQVESYQTRGEFFNAMMSSWPLEFK